ncbi:MAG: nicotinate-nucleotide adenylyltransferase [Vitreoscilla sp.]|nr:nicotinate (nicotinamide) nucleotide adenylyltransferase [Burkholderiales bacterium]MBP6338458.1 nicotinate-nucleotide adenylyltransferase [Vitreoscilla sp.]MBP6675955.1 nicotinate-nucleotide adenylyltransferase [Vitreoscilla sp.]
MRGGLRRIGLFGGSFNPPHLAHLALARLARDELQLQQVRWLPAGQPWQKPAGSLAPGEHRAAMACLLAQDDTDFVVDTREIERQGPSYTIDTVRELRAEQPGAEIVLIIGQDQYANLDTWRDAAQLRSLVTLAVAARNGRQPAPPAAWAHIPHRLVLLPLPPMAISATDIRQRIAQQQPIAALVGKAVAGYIDQHLLYRVPPGH